MIEKFNYRHLDGTGRKSMVDEIAIAIEKDELYFSTRFTSRGREDWPQLLKTAAEKYDEQWLASRLQECGAMGALEQKRKPAGGITIARTPVTAEDTLAEGQFNRFYIASVCQRAIASGQEHVTVYRGKHRGEPRSESLASEGTKRNANDLLKQVRSKTDSLKCDLLKPNSGLTVGL